MRYVCGIGVFALTAMLALPGSAVAQENPASPSPFFERASLEPTRQTPKELFHAQPAPPRLREVASRPAALVPLYASLGVLQGLDIHSTSRGLASGGREANPLMEPIVGNRGAFIAVKAATTVGVVWAAERLWRKDNRKAAVILTTLTNIGLAAVVAHNYRGAK